MELNHQLIAGIDPGLSGAICIVDRATGGIVAMSDMPTVSYRLVASGRARRKVDGSAVHAFLAQHRPSLVVIEEVNSHNMGRQSAFGFGWSAGVATAMAELTGAAVLSISPQKWKPRMGIPAGSSKDASRSLATGLCGDDAYWKRKKDADRSEAYLLASYGRMILAGEIVVEVTT